MKYKLTAVTVIMLALMFTAALLQAQTGEGEVNSSDQALHEKETAANEAIFSSFLDVTIPTRQNRRNIEIETGLAFTGYSDVRIPGNSGTLFSLSNDLEAEVTPAFRFRITQPLGERHNISVLAAPLHVVSKGTIDRDVNFEGEIFEAGTELEGTYWFNSYRLTYRYDIINTFRTEFGIGFTAKIREAGIRLESDTQSAKKTNVGFVPIINFRYNRYLGKNWFLLVEGDALAAPQGRAEDIYAGVKYKLNDWFKLKAGYRLLEGGADNDEVYNFALFNYATIGFEIGY